jgi:hypothetical protein
MSKQKDPITVRFEAMKDVLNEARVELPPALKKDGTPGKKPQVRFTCAECGKLFSRNNVQVDHIIPVVPLDKAESDMTYDDIVRGVCCNRENLQVVCSTPLKRSGGIPSCHKIKTDEENFLRRKLQIDDTLSLDKLKKEFQEYLAEKEVERLAKVERKRVLEAKKEAKRLEREEKIRK